MTLTLLPQARLRQPPVEVKLRTLRQILYDVERHQQKARPPLPVNTKGAKTVLGIKDHQKHLKDIKNAKQPTMWQKCASYYRTLLNDQKKEPEKFKNVAKMQQNLLMQQYSRLKRRQEKSLADVKIDMEYERLQKKYCPYFKLTSTPATKFQIENTSSHGKIISSTSGSYRLTKEKKKINRKIEKNAKKNNTKCLKASHELEKKQKSEDSVKTLTPEKPSKEKVVTAKKTSGKSSLPKAYPAISKYRVVPQAATSNCHKTVPEIDCSVMNKIFYHQPLSNTTAAPYSLKNKQSWIKHEIKQAIKEGKSTDPLVNNMLAAAIEKAQQDRIPWSFIQNVIESVKNSLNRKKVLHLLQIQLRQAVYILCTVRTCNFTQLILSLDKIMHPLKAQFAPVLHHFTHCCVIEALVPEKYRQLDSKQLSQHLNKESEILNVRKIDVLDASLGEVSIQCLPASMPNISRVLELKGYKILNSDYGFRANKEIILDSKTAVEYRRLLKNLMDIPDIETVTDNVIY